jgi:peptidoglycan-associated lipoprotein
MRKFLIFILIVFAFGCSKKYVQPHIYEKEKDTGKFTEEVTIEEKIPYEEARIRDRDMDMEVDSSDLERSQYEIKDVLFDYDKYDIRPDARVVLNSIATWLGSHRDVNVVIEGHCDERGTNEYNLALGEKRAKASRDYLISRGVSLIRMIVVTYGEEQPICIAPNEQCWQKNRRAHFIITK